MAYNRILGFLSAMLGSACLAPGHAGAGPVTFAWDPSQATPVLTSGPAAFSADAISLTNYIRTTNTNNLTTLRQTFSGAQIQTINGFTLGGAAVNVPGFNSGYGLYFRISPAGSFPINSNGTPIGPAAYSLLDVQLVADVGHDDGSVVNNVAGLGFSNAIGTSNDVVLATGSLLSASLALNANGTRNANYLTTFQPAAGEAGFFIKPSIGLDLNILLNTAPSAFQVIPVDSLTALQVVGADGNSTGTAQLVPEPASLALLAISLSGVAGSYRFRRSRKSASA